MKQLRYSILNPLIFLVIIWQVKLFEFTNDVTFVPYGIFPRDLSGLKGIMFWGFIHGDFEHLVSNSVPIFVLGTMMYYFYPKIANQVILSSYFLTGILVWLLGNTDGRVSFHIGASGIVYSIFAFLFFSGWFRKDKISVAISFFVTLFYGSIIWGVFPLERGISWEGHLFGLLSGLIFAFIYKKSYIVKPVEKAPVPDFRHPKINFIFQSSVNRQNTSHIVMVRPNNFGFNPETAESNVFQKSNDLLFDKNMNSHALKEFDEFVNTLRAHKINALVFEDQIHKTLPDAIFPNNWISMHHDGTVVYYPMLAKNRRAERREDIVDLLVHKYNFNKTRTLDLSPNEAEGLFLEGTGSILFDHVYKIAYANISSRTNPEMMINLSKYLGYEPVLFDAQNADGKEIYHANVLMSVGEKFVIFCFDVLKNEQEKALLKSFFEQTGKEIIEITEEQMNNFCGNTLEVVNLSGQKYLIMSTRAFNHFTEEQKATINKYAHIIHSDLQIIENFGGGGARCMMAEVFLP